MTSPKGLTLNTTNFCRLKFRRRFLRSLMEIRRCQKNHNNFSSSSSSSSTSSSCFGEIRKRSQRIKLAAYASMAYAVGPRKAWTRALLLKLKNRSPKRRRFARNTSLLRVKKKKKKVAKVNHAKRYKRPCEREIFVEKTEKLRQLVPGGKAMGICSLFEETAHFIKSLTMQVQVMQDITDQLSK